MLAATLGAAVAAMAWAPAAAEPSGTYTLVDGWPQVSSTLPMGFVSWVALDSQSSAFVFRRCPVRCSDGTHPAGGDPPASILLFDKTGRYQKEWEPKSGGKAREAHGLQIDGRGHIWTTDVQLHVVREYSADGALLRTLGTSGVPGESADKFDKPTNVLAAADGSIFVTDGYGNQRVVKFDKDGKFVKAWGKKGTSPGEFRIPHGIAEDRDGRIIVADRCGLGETRCTDGRIQIFDANGTYIAQWTAPNRTLAPQAVAVDQSNRLYIDDTQNSKVWILDARTLETVDSIDGASGHGMTISPTGDDVYVTGGAGGVKRYSRASSGR
jgi:DNA-binding beta-propeller fold protein YncE